MMAAASLISSRSGRLKSTSFVSRGQSGFDLLREQHWLEAVRREVGSTREHVPQVGGGGVGTGSVAAIRGSD